MLQGALLFGRRGDPEMETQAVQVESERAAVRCDSVLWHPLWVGGMITVVDVYMSVNG